MNDITQLECLECKEVRPIEDFRKWMVKENRQLYCRDCRNRIRWQRNNKNHSEYFKEYYKRPENKFRQKEYSKLYLAKLKSDPQRYQEFRDKLNKRRNGHNRLHTFRRLRRLLLSGKTKVDLTAIDLWKIAKKQKCKCALSGQRLTNENVSADHIVCKTHGGLTNTENIRLVTKAANIARNSLSDQEFIAFCKNVAEFNK